MEEGVEEEQASERGELHFLAALVDELMKALLANGANINGPSANPRVPPEI